MREDLPTHQPPQEGTAKRVRRSLADGRQQLLIYLPPALIRELKVLALDEESSVSQLAEQALTSWLAGR
jgi:hypothetical protein